MSFGSVTLVPGLNVERTPTLLRAGFSSTSFVRFKDSLVQKYGGWELYYGFPLIGIPREMHAWQDLNQIDHLAIGTTQRLDVLTSGSLIDITPQTFSTTTSVPNISTTSGSSIVTIVDTGVTNPMIYDSVFFNVPVSIGGIILDGLYQIVQINGSHSYNIDSGIQASSTVNNPTSTNGTTAIGNNTLHFAATPPWVVSSLASFPADISVFDITNPTAIPSGTYTLSATGTTVVMSANASAPGVGNPDSIVFASTPAFFTTSGSAQVSVNFVNHGLSIGGLVVFPIPTSVGGVTISGTYSVVGVADVNDFSINASSLATSTTAVAKVMNSGLMNLTYFISIGPAPSGFGYSLDPGGPTGYSRGGYGGVGSGGGGQQTGTEISAVDWSLDNWGSYLMACPKNGGLYYWNPQGGFLNATLISSAPPFNTGMFVSMSQQILVAFGSSVQEGIGWQQQPLLVQWSDAGDFLNWNASSATQAGNYTLSPGSMIVAALAGSNQNLLWTDLDMWAMNYIGPPDVYGFNKIGAGMGAVSMHSVQQLRGSVFWMGRTNLYSYTGGGANVIPCPVWDAVFQNLNTNYLQNVRAMPNTPFNEVGWLYPSAGSVNGECDSYVKFNITEPGAPWDIGSLQRSAWIDQTVLGNPIGASPQSFIYQHETTPDADGVAMNSTFTSGEFYLSEAEDFVFVDQIIPDFKWSTYTGSTSAQIQISFNVTNYPGDIPVVYGPYTVNNQTQYISTRFRGRLMSITVQSDDLGSFWRIGSCKYRYSPAGRR